MNQPRTFWLQRHQDVTGASGTGHVADGALWPDATITLHWRGEFVSNVFYGGGMASIERRHVHAGRTTVVWDEPGDSASGFGCRWFLMYRGGSEPVADGVEWPDGTATVHWRNAPDDIADVFHLHGMRGVRAISNHDGRTQVVWYDQHDEGAGRG